MSCQSRALLPCVHAGLQILVLPHWNSLLRLWLRSRRLHCSFAADNTPRPCSWGESPCPCTCDISSAAVSGWPGRASSRYLRADDARRSTVASPAGIVDAIPSCLVSGTFGGTQATQQAVPSFPLGLGAAGTECGQGVYWYECQFRCSGAMTDTSRCQDYPPRSKSFQACCLRSQKWFSNLRKGVY